MGFLLSRGRIACRCYASNICDKQALDFMGRKICHTTYPLRDITG